MMRDASSVRLIWSVGCTPGIGGFGGLPPGFLPVSPAFDLSRQAHCVGYVRPVGLLRQDQQFLYLGFEVRFDLLDVPMGERAVARGVGVNLGAVQADRAQLQQFHLLRQFQHLHKDARHLVQKAPPERHRIKGRLLDLPGGKYAGCVTINQQ